MAATTLRRIAPVFVTTDLARALAHYQRLGFTVQAYDDADYYGYASRDGVEIHLARVDRIDLRTTTSCATCGWTTPPRCTRSGPRPVSRAGCTRPSGPTTGSTKAPTSIRTGT